MDTGKVDGGEAVALNLKNPDTHELARRLADRLGTTMADAVHRALEDALRDLPEQAAGSARSERLREIAEHCAALPVRDDRPADEVLGYDERGMPR